MIYVSVPAPILDGNVIEADSAKLSDPTGAFGIRNADTLQVAVPDGTDLVFVNGDTYEYSFVGDDTITYEAWFELVVDGETFWSKQIVLPGGGTPPADTTTIKFLAIDKGEVVIFANDELPVLTNPTNTFGVKRDDTGAVVVPAGMEMMAEGVDGLYIKPFYSPEENLVYRFYVHALGFYIPSITVAPTKNLNSVMLAIGRYTNSYLIGQRFGHENMHKWLSLPMGDYDEPIDYARRAYDFIEAAEQMVDDLTYGPFYKGPYDLEYETVPSLIVQCATALAGVAMYEARGVDDVNPETNEPFHRLRYARQSVLSTLKRIAMGKIALDTPAAQNPIQHPQAGAVAIETWEDRLDG